mgnify:CR=1 FL=1
MRLALIGVGLIGASAAWAMKRGGVFDLTGSSRQTAEFLLHAGAFFRVMNSFQIVTECNR